MELAIEAKNPEEINAATGLAGLAQMALLRMLDRVVAFQEDMDIQRTKAIQERREKTTIILVTIAIIVFTLGLFISIFVFQRETRQTNSLFREISERKQAEVLVMVSKEEADIANRAKFNFWPI